MEAFVAPDAERVVAAALEIVEQNRR